VFLQINTKYCILKCSALPAICGGVIKQEKLYELIRKQFLQLLNEYFDAPNINNLIVASELKD